MDRRYAAVCLMSCGFLAASLASAIGQINPIPTSPTTKPGANPPSRTVTMEEAVKIALENSRSLRIAAEGVAKARGRLNENKAGFLPSVTSEVDVTHLDSGSNFTIIGQDGQPQTVPIIRQDQKSVNINAGLPIDILGQIKAAVDAAHFQEIAARLEFNRTRNQVVLDTKNAYYDVLRAKAFVAVSDQALKNARDREATAELYLKTEVGTKFDVLRAQTEVANALQNQISAQNRVNLAIATLNNILGLDQNTPLNTVEAKEPDEPKKDFGANVSEAYGNRPEILEADAQIKAAEKGVVIAQRSILPSTNLTWGFQYTPDAGGFAPKETSWQAVARFSIPIFEGGLAKARIQQARADVNTAKVNKQVTSDNVALEVRQAFLNLTEAQDRLNVTTAALTEAREQYRLAEVRFKAGVTLVPGGSPLLEISDAQTALTQAQSNQVNAQYDFQNAKARLDKAIGRYAFDGTKAYGLPAPRPVK